MPVLVYVKERALTPVPDAPETEEALPDVLAALRTVELHVLPDAQPLAEIAEALALVAALTPMELLRLPERLTEATVMDVPEDVEVVALHPVVVDVVMTAETAVTSTA